LGLLLRVLMRKSASEINRSLPRLPEKVRLIRTGEICENHGYYGNLFTLKLPDGRMTEVHRRELDLQLQPHSPTAPPPNSHWPSV
jgi:hypothetical protein